MVNERKQLKHHFFTSKSHMHPVGLVTAFTAHWQPKNQEEAFLMAFHPSIKVVLCA